MKIPQLAGSVIYEDRGCAWGDGQDWRQGLLDQAEVVATYENLLRREIQSRIDCMDQCDGYTLEIERLTKDLDAARVEIEKLRASQSKPKAKKVKAELPVIA